MSDVEMAYCVPYELLDRAVGLAETLLSTFGADIDGVSLVTDDHGVFEVRIDEAIVFDKAEDEADETAAIRNRIFLIANWTYSDDRSGYRANDLVACTTTTGQQYLYEGRELFRGFRETTLEIARFG